MSEEFKMPKFELSPAVSIIIAGALVAGAIIFVNLHPAAPAEAQQGDVPAETAHVPLPTPSDHIVGSPGAPIVLVEYSDFQCPFCSMIYPTLKQIVSESNGQVSWVMRAYPLYQIHPNALPAANAAECIADQLGNDGFWKFADAVFADQSKLSSTYYSQVAGLFGANTAAFDACVSSKKFGAKIDKETADAENSGGNGTPYTVVINTKTGKQYPISGALPYAQIMSVINKAENSQ
jgi:protein-disulfide isomerase